MRREVIVAFALAMGCSGNHPAPTPSGTSNTTPATSATAAHRLIVKVRGSGSVLGGVRSQPAGIDCQLQSNQGGANEKECVAEFSAETVTLSFVPGGAASVAQFSVTRAGARAMCEGKMAAATCTLDLTSDATVEVFPISAPPPPP